MRDFFRRLLQAFRGIPAVLRELPRLGTEIRDVWRALRRAIGLLSRGRFPQRPPRSRCCFQMPDVYVRPDPLIYAQYYLMANGLAVTWDNPDIELFDHGTLVSSSALQPDREYDVHVRVWNGSYDAPAIGVGVTLSFLDFGIGMTSTLVGKTLINLGVKGASDHPSTALFKWRTPPAPGHYCLQAQLDWHDDANPNNNLGQENVQVGVIASPAKFVFKIRNDASVRRRFVLAADAYQLPGRPPCEEDTDRFGRTRPPTRIAESRARWAWARKALAHGTFPIADNWTIEIDPIDPVLAPGEDREVRVAIEPNFPFTGTKNFNVNAFAVGGENERTLVGGVTLVVTR
jgi:hypothetical protein